jgi:hypothetical protein
VVSRTTRRLIAADFQKTATDGVVCKALKVHISLNFRDRPPDHNDYFESIARRCHSVLQEIALYLSSR